MNDVVNALVKWIGHATALVELAGERVLIDPLGRRRCRHIGEYHTILITHAHVDHLNRWTLSVLDRSARLIVPKGAGPIVADLGFSEVLEIEAGDDFAAGRLDVLAVPTRHDNGRWRKNDAPTCAGYIIAHDGVAIHHAGDVDMSDFGVFDEIGRSTEIDVTMLPIGGMLPVWYYRWRRKALDRGVHIDPDAALEVAQRLRAKTMVPVHWGTVNLRLGPSSAPRKRLQKVARDEGLNDLVCVLGHGEDLEIKGSGT